MEKSKWLEIAINNNTFENHKVLLCNQEQSLNNDETTITTKKQVIFNSIDLNEARQYAIEYAQKLNEQIIIKEYER